MVVTPGAHVPAGVPTPAKNHHTKAFDHIAS